jgi:hypothetical protein
MRIPHAGIARSLVLLLLVLGAASLCSAADITYYVNQPIGAGGVTGTIVTDGTIGALNSGDILSWNLTLNDGTATANLSSSSSNSQVAVHYETYYGADDPLSATATQMLFNFSDNLGTSSVAYFLFESNTGPGYLCFVTPTCGGGVPGTPGAGVEQVSASEIQPMQYVSLTGTQVIASTRAPSATPEPSSFVLLGTGVMGLLGAIRRRLA